jgi:asparagine synthase (glutamine-hydrolysing)
MELGRRNESRFHDGMVTKPRQQSTPNCECQFYGSCHHFGLMETMDASCTLKVIGYCEKPEASLIKSYGDNDLASLTNLRGEYTLVFQSPSECCIVTSPIGAMHYFYTIQKGAIHHGERIVDILKEARLAWAWNWQALGDLCQLENLTNNNTLHPAIQRVPPGSILRYRNGRLDLRSKAYLDCIASQHSDPTEAVAFLNEEVAAWTDKNPYLSLSGGFDSRVILSSLLAQGVRPHLITMGSDESSDVRVARSIAQRFSLEHDLIKIKLDDLITHGSQISALTNGSKTAWHWHSYLYPLKAAIPSTSTFFVGTLGEFARCYYFDKGVLGRVANAISPFSLKRFWKLKLNRHPTFDAGELASLTTPFAQQLGPEGIEARSERLKSYCHDEFLSGLTRYYFEQRVPNFYGNGIKMYLASSQWRSPFHGRKWIDSIWNLDTSWKLGSNWHRHAIATNFPELLEFPEENGFDRTRMLRVAPLFYWTPLMRRTPYITYDMSARWYGEPMMQEYLRSHLACIDDLIDPSAAEKIVDSHRNGIDRTRTIAFLLTMIHWKQVVKELSSHA